ncbi:MAG TPA: NUDIX hydrolase [Candidatus Dormibacteraeota bacterium]|jgi:8-oxo-dGTP pyrophosphatase MutT (NUDIX family)
MSGADETTDGAPGPVIRGLSTRIVYENRWMRVREDEILRPDGSTGAYGVVDKPDFALVIPLDGDGVHLVEQYRYAVAARSWEFPQGTYPDRRDGDPAELARIELEEETGLRAAHLQHLGYLYQGPGHSSQGMNVFVATGLSPGQARRELEEQDMRQRWVSRAELEEMIGRGGIRDSSSVAAYALLVLHERRSEPSG